MKPFKRTDRIASEIRGALAMLILSEIEDPRVRMGVVTGVKVTADMSLCRVYVRSIQGDAQGKAELLAGLQKSSAFLRRELAQRVSMLRMPKLEFYYDDVPDQAARVEELLFHIPKPPKEAMASKTIAVVEEVADVVVPEDAAKPEDAIEPEDAEGAAEPDDAKVQTPRRYPPMPRSARAGDRKPRRE